MAWAYFAARNNEAGQYGGVYHSQDFTTSGAQPTWRKINDGLPNANIVQMRADSVRPAEVQYVLLADYSVYRRDITINAGRWEKIIDRDQALTLAGGGNPLYGYYISWIAPHQTKAGSLAIAYYHLLSIEDWPTWEVGAFVMTSEDYGENWTALQIPSKFIVISELARLWLWGIGTVEWTVDRDDVDLIYMGCVTGISPTLQAVTYWPATASPWGIGPIGSEALGYSDWKPGIVIDTTVDCGLSNQAHPWPDNAYYLGSGDPSAAYPRCIQKASISLTDHDSLITTDPVQDGAELTNLHYVNRSDSLWISRGTAGHHRNIKDNTLYYTADRWATMGSVTIDTALELHNLAAYPDDDTAVFLTDFRGRNPVYELLHHVFALTSETSTELIGRGGPNVGAAPYTNSIPADVGVIARNGLIVTGEPRRVGIDVYSVEYGDVGTAQGHYLHGDQAVWDDMAQPEEHAKDIADNLPVYHVPEPLAVGDMLVAALVDGHLVWTIGSGAVVVPGETLTDDNGDILIDDVGSVLTEG